MTLQTARRLLMYVSALVALVAVLAAVSGVLSLLTSMPADPGDARDALSRYLATLILALPALLFAWSRAERHARESQLERHAVERRCFLAGVFAGCGLVGLYALTTLLQAVLTLPDLGGRPAREAAIRMLVYGVAWLVFARVEWRERSPSAQNPPHDAAVFALAGCALHLLLSGAIRAIREILILLTGAGAGLQALLPQFDRWTWGPIAGLLLAGGACWGAIWRYDLRRGGRRGLRVIYLYVVVLICAYVALSDGIAVLYLVIRGLLGNPEGWDFLHRVLPGLLVCGAAWAYHWQVLRQQRAEGEEVVPRGIPAACRPGLAALCWVGIMLAAAGAISLIWLVFEALLVPGNHPDPGWWRDWASADLALLVVGLACWSGPWRALQRAARERPRVERTTRARRVLLGAVVATTALPGVGYAIATLRLILAVVLGGELTREVICRVAQYWCAAACLATLAVVHAALLRRDLLYADSIGQDPPGAQEPPTW